MTTLTRSVASISTSAEGHLLLFTQLEPNEPPDLDVLTNLRRRFLDKIADRLLRLANPCLVNERDVLVVRLHLASNDLLDQMIRLAALLHLLDEDAALLINLVLRNLVLVDRDRRGGGNVLGDLLHQRLEVIGARDKVGLAVDFNHHTDLPVVMDVAADQSLARLLADSLLGFGDSLGAKIL